MLLQFMIISIESQIIAYNLNYFVLLQIYSQYVEVQDALQQEKTENTRLKMYMDQILKVHMYM